MAAIEASNGEVAARGLLTRLLLLLLLPPNPCCSSPLAPLALLPAALLWPPLAEEEEDEDEAAAAAAAAAAADDSPQWHWENPLKKQTEHWMLMSPSCLRSNVGLCCRIITHGGDGGDGARVAGRRCSR